MKLKRLIAVLGLMTALAGSNSARGDELATQLRTLIEQRAPAVVSVRMVLKTQARGAGGQESESRLEIPGVVVDKAGLVMISNLPFSPATLREMVSGRAAPDSAAQPPVSPSDFKILFGQDPKEYTAFLAATDAKLHLTFLKLDDATSPKPSPVDFSGTGTAGIGDTVIGISRLRKGYDYAPFLQIGRIGGQVEKPRTAWLLEGGVPSLGLPVFAANGDVLGVVTTVETGGMDETDLSSMGYGMVTHQYFATPSPIRAFVVPAHAVQAVIMQAEEAAAKLAAERNQKPKP